MAKNDFKAFAIGENANTLSQEEYESSDFIGEGFKSGIARSERLNKVWRQSSVIAAVIGKYIAEKTGEDVMDDGDLEKLVAQLDLALKHKITTEIPAASLTQKGISQLNSATNSDREDQAATPKAVHDVRKIAESKLSGVSDASLTQKGIVQLSSATNSTNETLAATPKAVKGAYDFANTANVAAKNAHDEANRATDNANSRLAKNQNGADIPNKSEFIKNLGLTETVNLAKSAVPNSRKVNGKVLSGDVNITSQDIFNGQAISIPDKADLNDYQTPGLYYQGLNVQATAGKNYPEASAGSLVVLQAAGTIQRYFVYNSSRIYTRALYPWSGPGWTPWAQEYNTQNKPIAGDVGAYPKSGGIVNGNVDATGYISGKGVYEAPGVRVYSSMNKPSPGELGAYTTGECDNRYALKNDVGVINLRLGSWVTEGGWTDETKDWSAPSGHVLVGLGTVMWSSGRQHLASVHYRPVQAYINGIWVTISSI